MIDLILAKKQKFVNVSKKSMIKKRNHKKITKTDVNYGLNCLVKMHITHESRFEISRCVRN